MKEPSVFYRAMDPQKGSWDGYGCFVQNESDFLAYVADAPSGASIQTPELIRAFWTENLRDASFSGDPALGCVELADSINRLQDFLRRKSRSDAALYQSTLCLARKYGRRLFYASIGDSCMFLLRKGTLYRLDTAETWNGALVARPQEPLKERQKTGPIAFAGVDGAFVSPSSVRMLELNPGERLVLATDGVSDVLSPAALATLLQSSNDSLRMELDRFFGPDRIPDDVTLMILDPDVPQERDLALELQSMRGQLDRLQNDNARLHRELERASTFNTRIEKLEKRASERREPVVRTSTAAPHSEARFVKSTAAARTAWFGSVPLWLWIGAAFAGGLILGLSFFLWTSQSAANPEEKAAVTQSIPEHRPVIAPPEFREPTSCLYVVQSGDTLGKIALARNLSMENLLRLNPGLKSNSSLKIGQKVQVCKGDER